MTRPLSAEDRLAVMDLIADYGASLEAGDVDAYVGNFTPDGVLEGGTQHHEGRAAIRRFVEHLIAIGQDGPDGHRHILGLPAIRAEGDGCRARTYVIIPGEAGEDAVNVRSIGIYTDRIVMHEGRWRFAHRRLDMVLRRGSGS